MGKSLLSSPLLSFGAPPPRLDEACAPAPPVHALGASNRLGQVFMVRRSVPYHAFMPRRSASASPPCSCSRAGAFLWGGLAAAGHPLHPGRCALPCRGTPQWTEVAGFSSELLAGTRSSSWRRCQGVTHAGVRSTPGMAAPLLSCACG